jgi:ferredoxin
LLKIAASVAKWSVEITPDNCSKCRLCEEVCPYGAVRPPDYGQPEPAALKREGRRLAWLVVLLPLLALAGGWVGGRFSQTAALAHPTVSLAERYARQGDQAPKAGAPLDEVRALERARQNPKGLMAEAAAIRGKFRLGGRLFGAWVGLVIGAKLLSVSLRRRRTEFEPDRGACVACARCIDFCPHEVKRRRANRRPAPARPTLQVT